MTGKRLISQDNCKNVPYDMAIICLSDKEIHAYIPGFDEWIVMAKYSTHAKAKDVFWVMNYTLVKENTFEFLQEEEVV